MTVLKLEDRGTQQHITLKAAAPLEEKTGQREWKVGKSCEKAFESFYRLLCSGKENKSKKLEVF